MKKNKSHAPLERVLTVTSWVTIGGTAVWVLALPWICNLKLFMKTHYTFGPWAEALSTPEFWTLLIGYLVPTAAVFLVMSQGLRILSHVRRGELFCAQNVQAMRLAGGTGLAAAVWVLLSAAFTLPMPLSYYLQMLIHPPMGPIWSLAALSDTLLRFGVCLMGGLFCLLVGQFLRRGLELQEDSDLTI